jgi:integration host factor subunit alpha
MKRLSYPNLPHYLSTGVHCLALTKADIIQIVTKETGLTKNKSGHVVEQLLEIIKRTLAAGDDVLVSGFRKFRVQNKSERRGRNPVTGEDLMLKPLRVVTFKCSGKLRDRGNG